MIGLWKDVILLFREQIVKINFLYISSYESRIVKPESVRFNLPFYFKKR